MPQLRIDYLYRDASNYKNHGSLVIQNNQELTVQKFSLALREHFACLQCFPDVLHFSPEVLGWPTLYFEDWTEDDFMLHEVSGIEETDQESEFLMPRFIDRGKHGEEMD